MTLKIPEECMPVVEIIRREVSKPTKLPIATQHHKGRIRLRFVDEDLSSPHYRAELDPMGLCDQAMTYLPTGRDDFCYDVPEKSIIAFARWWDSLTDAQAAVDAVWGPAKDFLKASMQG